MTPVEAFATRGFVTFPVDSDILAWAEAALPIARNAIEAPDHAADHQCGGTWFVGVDALPNEADGAIAGVPLRGPVLQLIAKMGLTPLAWHRAQVSAVYPGYPRPRAGETPGAFRYRQQRDAAHVDGLLADGTPRRRYLREPHAFVLGLPLNDAPPDAAPLVAWAGSHLIMGRALSIALAPHDVASWPDVDLTEPYKAARREVFETCTRIELPAKPGQATLLHRHILHGIAPWRAEPSGARVVAYFRPFFWAWSEWAM